MANAKREEVTIRVKQFTLNLSEEEAQVLVGILGRIGGLGHVRDLISNNPDDSIYHALKEQVGSWTLDGVEGRWRVNEDTKTRRC